MTDSKLNNWETAAVLRALCAGYDPDTGRVLPEQYIPRSEAVLAALHHAASALEEVNKKSEQVTKPHNQGKRWTDEEEKILEREFRQQASLIQIARLLERTIAGIRFRLESLGLLENLYVPDETSEPSHEGKDEPADPASRSQQASSNQQLTEEQLQGILEECRKNNESIIQRDIARFIPQLELLTSTPSSSEEQQLATEITNYFFTATEFSLTMEDVPFIEDQGACDELIAELEQLGSSLDQESILFKRIQKEIRGLIESRADLPTGAQHQKARTLNEARKKLDRNAPICGHRGCTSQMTIREGKGDFFWGCKTFPNCWGRKFLSKAERDMIPD
ncbi:MAG: hypothetical protein O2936_13345 [Proteobacteria bacterium]|nr:hypothetical protein [Pseudomonadota bacterium]